METRTDLLCTACIHCKLSPSDFIFFRVMFFLSKPTYLYKCDLFTEEEMVEHNLVTAPKKKKKQMRTCTMARCVARPDDDSCGPDAKYWTPKHKKHLFLMLTK